MDIKFENVVPGDAMAQVSEEKEAVAEEKKKVRHTHKQVTMKVRNRSLRSLRVKQKRQSHQKLTQTVQRHQLPLHLLASKCRIVIMISLTHTQFPNSVLVQFSEIISPVPHHLTHKHLLQLQKPLETQKLSLKCLWSLVLQLELLKRQLQQCVGVCARDSDYLYLKP
jgi:hypothetical protein